jgi:protein involved in polysaccharide export with SLBB domain
MASFLRWREEACGFAAFRLVGNMNLRCLLLIGAMFLGGAAQMFSAVAAGEALKIEVKGVPAEEKMRIDANYPVAADGTINLSFVGKLRVAGMDPAAIAESIRKAYIAADIFLDPTFSVMKAERGDIIVDQVVTIGGQVRKLGSIAYVEGMTIEDVIKEAGGATEFGSMKRVMLYRKETIVTHDLTNPENRGFLLEPDDTVDVTSRFSECR